MSLSWIPLSSGHITAAGAPGQGRLDQWVAAGATDILTLQRADEHAADLPDRCKTAGLHWTHIPLSGRRLEQPSDRDGLHHIRQLSLSPNQHMVVHCSAGLHRTGACLYLMLRGSGLTPDEAIDQIRLARPLTAAELVQNSRRSGRLCDRAEEFFLR
jgi:protein-tyrosine phosphatase